MKGGEKVGHIKMYCDGCGSSWDVYSRDDLKNRRSRTCPVCGSAINQGVWERTILQAFAWMEQTNRELVRDHAGNHRTLFTVSYCPDVIFPNRRTDNQEDLKDEISEVKDGLEDLRKTISKIIEN